MVIAFVSLMRVSPWGGSEDLWYKAAKIALTKGHTVSVLTQKWNETPENIIELESLGAKVNFYYKKVYSLLERTLIRVKLRKYLEDSVPEIEADIYVISNGSTFDFVYNDLVMNMVLSTGKPYIMISQHGYENGNIINSSRREFYIDIFQKARKNIFVSERNRKNAERQIAFLIKNACTISNPVKIKEPCVKPFPTSAKLTMACVARFDCSFKGQDILLQALSTPKWKERDFQLSLYGSGPDSAHIQNLINLYSLNDKVKIKGYVSNVDEIWGLNQVLVMPSLSEGTSLSLVEAMLSGRSVVSTNVGDHSKYVVDGETGFLANCASPECLDSALEKLWLVKHTLDKMGERAFNHAIRITDLHPDATLLNYIESIKQ